MHPIPSPWFGFRETCSTVKTQYAGESGEVRGTPMSSKPKQVILFYLSRGGQLVHADIDRQILNHKQVFDHILPFFQFQ